MAFEQLSFRRYGRIYRNAQKYASRREVLISSYLILSLFTVSFFAAVFIRPTAIKIALLWREIQDKRVVYSQLEKKIKDLEDAQTLLGSIEDDLPLLTQTLPSDPQIPRLMQKVEYLASVHGLHLSSGKYPPVPLYGEPSASPSSALSEYPFKLEFVGTSSQILSFLRDYENLDRYINLSLIGLQPLDTPLGKELSQLTLTLESTTYSYATQSE